METIKLRYALISVLLMLTVFTVKYFNYDQYYKSSAGLKTIEKIPHRIGPWDGHDVSLDEKVYEILETRAIINRNYTFKNNSVFLSIVHYPETKVDFHAPEGCLAGKGIEITKTKKKIVFPYQGRLINLELNQFVRGTNSTDELVYYFYKSGSFVGSSYIKLRFMLALNKFSTSAKSGSLIRVSTPVLDGSNDSEDRLKRFVEMIYPDIIKNL